MGLKMKLCKNPNLNSNVLIDNTGAFHYKDGDEPGTVIGLFWMPLYGFVQVTDVYMDGVSQYDVTARLYEES